MIISGSSHVVRIISGVDRGSAKNIREKFILESAVWKSMERLIRLIRMLCVVELIQIIFFFDSHVRGISMIVGIINFSIVGG